MIKRVISILLLCIVLNSCSVETTICGEVISKPDPQLNTYTGNLDYYLGLEMENGLLRWVTVEEGVYYSSYVGQYLCQDIE